MRLLMFPGSQVSGVTQMSRLPASIRIVQRKAKSYRSRFRRMLAEEMEARRLLAIDSLSWTPMGNSLVELRSDPVNPTIDRVTGQVSQILTSPNGSSAWIGTNSGVFFSNNYLSLNEVQWGRQSPAGVYTATSDLEMDRTGAIVAGQEVLVMATSPDSRSTDRANFQSLYRTTNGGVQWTAVDGGGGAVGKVFSSVLPLGTNVYGAISNTSLNSLNDQGLYRITLGQGASTTKLAPSAFMVQATWR